MLLLKFILMTVVFIPLTALIPTDPEQLLGWCLNAKSHKTKPGPEDDLHKQCKPWEKRSCCTTETTVNAHYSNMYNFDWNHCSHVKSLSNKCKEHFIQDLCFYECSPNVGPWVVSVDQKIRKEKFVDIPLCATDCDKWFEDCIDDYTCTDNWGRNFDWINGSNKCPAGSTCNTFKDIYRTSQNFCERIWDHSWKYTSNDDHCMRLWFNGTIDNPNDKIAQWKVNQIKKTFYSSSSISTYILHSSSNLIVLLTFHYYWFY